MRKTIAVVMLLAAAACGRECTTGETRCHGWSDLQTCDESGDWAYTATCSWTCTCDPKCRCLPFSL